MLKVQFCVAIALIAGWCRGQGSSFAVIRLWVRFPVTSHAAVGSELSTHLSQLALPHLIWGSAQQIFMTYILKRVSQGRRYLIIIKCILLLIVFKIGFIFTLPISLLSYMLLDCYSFCKLWKQSDQLSEYCQLLFFSIDLILFSSAHVNKKHW